MLTVSDRIKIWVCYGYVNPTAVGTVIIDEGLSTHFEIACVEIGLSVMMMCQIFRLVLVCLTVKYSGCD